MILVISESNDYSTLEVVRWLDYFNVEFVRINDDDEITILEINLTEFRCIVDFKGRVIDFSQIKKIWYRRGNLNFRGDTSDPHFLKVQKWEAFWLNELIFEVFITPKSIGNYNFKVNKLTMLLYAQECGLNVPQSIITSDKMHMQQALKHFSGSITKTIGYQLMYEVEGGVNAAYTEELTYQDLDDYEQVFFPSLIQKKIEKKYEVRSFFLVDKFYSMAIFSQNNQKTKTDFRKYDRDVPNRTVPFNLPRVIETQLKRLFQKINLDTGSVDLLIDKDGNFIFLEINPVGQFSFVSKPCNFLLEKEIALRLL